MLEIAYMVFNVMVFKHPTSCKEYWVVLRSQKFFTASKRYFFVKRTDMPTIQMSTAAILSNVSIHAVTVFNLDYIRSLQSQRWIRLCFKLGLHKELWNTTGELKWARESEDAKIKRTELDSVISAAVENDPTQKHHLKVFPA